MRKPACLFALWIAFASTLHAQPAPPHLGYVYPAGGRQGATFQVTVGGQFLNNVSNAYVSGDGIQAKVVEYNRPMNQKEFTELRDMLRPLQEKRRASLQAGRRGGGGPAVMAGTNAWTSDDERRFSDIRNKILKNPPNRQGNPAIAETVIVQLTVAPNAEPGDREIRLGTPNAVSNPLVFRVGQLPEFSKPATRSFPPELNALRQLDPGAAPTNASPKSEIRVSLPAVVNGQIMPGEEDRIRFSAPKGMQLVAAASARELIPYLADAVPGWFQATLTLSDSKGHELAYDDRYRFHPDPVIHCEIPKDGEYVLEIKDSIYRGREDFVYRVTIGELPFVSGIYPLGGTVGTQTPVQLDGWNLPAATVTQEVKTAGISSLSVRMDGKLSNFVPFAGDTLPECVAREGIVTPSHAQQVSLPIIVNGRVTQPGQWSVFRFDGSAGAQVVAEVYARRLDSPLDSVLKFTDTKGRQLAFNDDFEDKGAGLITHQADSYLTATLPESGGYYLYLGDAQQKAGPAYAYRLRVSQPLPDFALRVVPSGVSARPGMSVPITVHALRRDGFDGAIDLALKDAPLGFTLSGARIPPKQDQARLTLTAPMSSSKEPISLTLEGRASIQGREVTHAAVPAEDMMQAFAYRHWVPAKEFKVAVAERGLGRPPFKILDPLPLKIPTGETVRLRIGPVGNQFTDNFQLELNDAPEGIHLQKVEVTRGAAEILFQCDPAKVKPGLEGNLIINLFSQRPQLEAAKGKAQPNRQRSPVGVLPAIPFIIVPRE